MAQLWCNNHWTWGLLDAREVTGIGHSLCKTRGPITKNFSKKSCHIKSPYWVRCWLGVILKVLIRGAGVSWPLLTPGWSRSPPRPMCGALRPWGGSLYVSRTALVLTRTHIVHIYMIFGFFRFLPFLRELGSNSRQFFGFVSNNGYPGSQSIGLWPKPKKCSLALRTRVPKTIFFLK